jgi:DNA-binding transcriptional regulator PaaX
VVREAEQPYRARDLFSILRKQGHSESLARAAVWFLVDSGQLAFTPNWRLTLEPVSPAAHD